jgi:hypothetical protein
LKKNIKDKKYSFCYETNKRKFPDEISAKLFLARLDKKDWWKQSINHKPCDKRPIRTYKCQFCNKFHLTSQEEIEYKK